MVLNSKYFRAEASELWKNFVEVNGNAPVPEVPLTNFLNDLTQAEGLLQQKQSIDSDLKSRLLEHLIVFKKQMELAAWQELFQRTRSHGKNDEKAKQEFIARFTEIRKDTIEYHELSHLLDEALWKGEKIGPEKAALSEVRAFITELAYGSNPHDSLWQAVTGAIDEIKKGQNRDASVAKLCHFLKTASCHLTPAQQKDCLRCICCLSRASAKQVAMILYQNSLKM